LSAAHQGGGYDGKRRVKYIHEILDNTRKGLDRQCARYREIHEKGMEAIDDWIAEHWRQRVHTGSVKSTDFDPVSTQLASCYREIRYSKGRIVACEQALADLERDRFPLLHWQD
jgi:hypothetical protein